MLADQVAIVSGVGTGLGRSIAISLAGEGASVVLAARDAERLDGVAAEIEHDRRVGDRGAHRCLNL